METSIDRAGQRWGAMLVCAALLLALPGAAGCARYRGPTAPEDGGVDRAVRDLSSAEQGLDGTMSPPDLAQPQDVAPSELGLDLGLDLGFDLGLDLGFDLVSPHDLPSSLDAVAVPDGAPPNQQLWLQTFGDASDEGVLDIAVDGKSIVVVGMFSGKLDLGKAVPTVASKGQADAFVAKFDHQGNPLWLRTFGGAGSDAARAVAIDPAGSVIVTGYGQGSVDYGGGPIPGKGDNDMFVVALDPAGKTLWADRPVSAGVDEGADVAVDAQGNVYITGRFYGSVDFGGKTITSAGSADISVFKYDKAGAQLWATRMGGPQLDDGRALAVGASGELWVTGVFRDTATFGPATQVAKGLQDIFVVRLDASTGGVKWGRFFGGAGGYNQGNALIVDPASGDALCAGSFVGTTDFGVVGKSVTATGSRDPFILRYDKLGNVQSVIVHTVSGSGEIKALDISASGRVLAGGTFTGSYDAGGGLVVKAASGLLDGFALRFTKAGKPTLLERYGGAGADEVLAVGALGNDLIVGGSFHGSASFGKATRTSAGQADAFLLAIGP